MGFQKALSDQDLPQRQANRSIHIQQFYRSPTERCTPLQPHAMPAKVIIPLIHTRIEESGYSTFRWVYTDQVGSLVAVAVVTTEREILFD